MWWFAFLCFLVASMFAPKAVGIASLVLIATWLGSRLVKLFRQPEGDAGGVDGGSISRELPSDKGIPVVHVNSSPALPQTQAVVPAASVQESDEEFLARQRAANFHHDPSHG